MPVNVVAVVAEWHIREPVHMRLELIALFNELKETASFCDVPFDDVNDTNSDGENALHWAARANDLAAARLLIDAGIEIDKHGDLGYTPLHDACSAGHVDMVRLLVESGADLYATTEGYPPFTLARFQGHDHICDLLKPFMDAARKADPDVIVKMRIKQLQSEIARLERLLR